MPIFEYVCAKCSHRFETLVFGSAEPECPSCRSTELEKQLSTFAVGSQGAQMAARDPVGPCGNCPEARGTGGCGMMNN